MADGDENVDSMETDSASEGKAESFDPPKRPDNLCCYSQKECDLEKLKGFDFCHKHILEDKASPFKQCSFVSKTNGKKCTNPAPKIGDGQKTYCLIHTRDSELRKVLEERTKKKKRKLSGQQEEHPRPSKPGPGRPPGVRNYTKRQKVLDLGSEYRRDDVLRVESSWHGDYESDTESLDNDMDDPLRHAGVWTAEEVTKMCRDKLLRLRSLYMSQFERLKHVYKNKRRKYLLATSTNEEGTTGATNGPKPNESVSAFHIASRCYNKRYRTDALLQKQSKEKRLGTALRSQILPQQRCAHYTDGNRCTLKIVPLAKFCLKHICDEPNQQLFLPCSQALGADQRCGVAIPNVVNHNKCILHSPHTNDLSVGDLEQELQHAKEQQIIKEREREDRRKAALAQAAHEAMLSEIAKSEALAAQQAQKPAEDVKTLATLVTTTNTQQDTRSAFDAQQKETPIIDLSSKLSGSPTTNLQIKIQPAKPPEILCKNTASILPLTSSQHNSKVGDPALVPKSPSISTTDAAPQTTIRAYSGNTLSIPSKIQITPTNAVASQTPTKTSASAKDNIPAPSITPPAVSSGSQVVTFNSPAATKPTIPVDSLDKGSSTTSDVSAKPEVSKPSTDPKVVQL